MKEEKLDYNEFYGLFGTWCEEFKPFIESKEMFNIYKTIKRDAEKEVICPDSENVFRAFATSNPGDVKSVWYMMDPYPKRYKNKAKQATGIAMDCSNSPDGKLQPSLEKFYEGMSKDVGKEVMRSPDLSYLSEQGILLLNTDLTCKLNKKGSHAKLWEPFHKYFLGEIMGKSTGIIYVLAGAASQRMEKLIYPVGNYIVSMDHPVSASYKDTEWDCKKIFTTINTILKQNNNEHVYWDKRDFDQHYEAPF